MARPLKTIEPWQLDRICSSEDGARKLGKELGFSAGLVSSVKTECDDPFLRARRIGIFSPENVPQTIPPVSNLSNTTALAWVPQAATTANTITNVRTMTSARGREGTSIREAAATTEQLTTATITAPLNDDAVNSDDADDEFDYNVDKSYSPTGFGSYYTTNLGLSYPQPQSYIQSFGSKIANLPYVFMKMLEDQFIVKAVNDFSRNLGPAYTPANVSQDVPSNAPDVAKPTPPIVGNYHPTGGTESTSLCQHANDNEKAASYVDENESDATDVTVDDTHPRDESYVSSDNGVTPPTNPPVCKNICICPSGNPNPRRIDADEPKTGGEKQETQTQQNPGPITSSAPASPIMTPHDSIERTNLPDTQGENQGANQSVDNAPNASQNIPTAGTHIVQIFVAPCQGAEQGSHETTVQLSNPETMSTVASEKPQPQTIPPAMVSREMLSPVAQGFASAKTQAGLQSPEVTNQSLSGQSADTLPNTTQKTSPQPPSTVPDNNREKPTALIERQDTTKCTCSDRVTDGTFTSQSIARQRNRLTSYNVHAI